MQVHFLPGPAAVGTQLGGDHEALKDLVQRDAAEAQAGGLITHLQQRGPKTNMVSHTCYK